MTIRNTRVGAELYDHPVAGELAELLPLGLVFTDFNQVEKVAPLDRPLHLRGVPDTDPPGPGEIGYHAPTQGIILYYASQGRWPGLVRRGRFSYDLSALQALPDRTRIRIAPAPAGTA